MKGGVKYMTNNDIKRFTFRIPQDLHIALKKEAERMNVSNPMKLVEADLKGQLINYQENPIDQWCLGNASMEIDNFGNVMAVKINNQQNRRIDGAVTLIILYEMYRRYRSVLLRKLR